MSDTTLRIALDRIEGSRAILDFGGELIEVPAAALPSGAAEGALLRLSAAPADTSAAEARLERLRARSGSLDDIDF